MKSMIVSDFKARGHSPTLLTADERILAYRAVTSHDARR